MSWRGPIKPIYVRLPQDLHSAVKSAAAVRSERTVERAYEQALNEWLKPDRAHTTSHEPRDGDMTESEAAVVERVLSVLRSGNKDAIRGLHSALDIGELLIQALIQQRMQRKQ